MKLTPATIFLPIILATGAVSRSLLADVTTYAPIRADVNTGLCLTAPSTADSAAIVLQPCTGSSFQAWGPFNDKTNIFRFQNAGSLLCLWVIDAAAAGQILFQGECTNSDGSGHPVSNAQFDTNGPTLPNDKVQLRSFVLSRDSLFCITVGFNGVNVILDRCGGLLSQMWKIEG